jgi:peptide deformylase
MAKLLPIVTLPNEKLRQLSEPVPAADIATPNFQTLCDNMIFTMYEDDGIGLAAPQVAAQVRVIVVGKDALAEQDTMPFSADEDLVLINPVIQTYSWKTELDDEGCLSVPGFGGLVERHTTVTIEALSRTGKAITFTAKKYFARVLQHEIDHLNGILFIDRAKEVWKHEKNQAI